MLIHSAVDFAHPTNYHRCVLPFRYLSKDYPQHQWVLGNEDSGCEIDCCWIYGCRPLEVLVEADRLRREGVRVIWTLDDLYFDFPQWRKKRPTEEQIAFCRLMPSVADLCIYSTPYLAQVHPQPQKAVVAPNLIEVASYGVSEPAPVDGPVRVLWAGASGHQGDLQVVDEALCRLREEFDAEQLEFHFVGALPHRLGRDHLGQGVRLHKHIELALYPHLLRQLRPHIALAPLADCPFNMAKCVTGDTLVVTDTGLKPMKTLVESQASHVRLENKKQHIASWYRYADQETVRVTTECGFQIEGTLTHKMRKPDGTWVALGDLQEGDVLEVAPYQIRQTEYQEVTHPLFMGIGAEEGEFDSQKHRKMLPRIVFNEYWGRFLGYVLGDGCIQKSGIGISCCTDYPDVLQDVKDTFTALGIRYGCTKKQDKRRGEHLPDAKGIDVKCHSRHLTALFHQIGMKKKNGKVFCVPQIILDSPKSVIREFLSALFETDGTVGDSGLSYTTKSEELARQVAFLLLGFGIKAKIRACRNKKYDRDYWTVFLGRQAADLFLNEIGFISQGKQEKLRTICSRPHSNAYKEWEWSDPVVKIERGRRADVYDLEVRFDHYYLANGLVSHNSNIRCTEAWSLAAALVASPVGEYRLIEDGSDGFLCETQADWELVLSQLVRDSDLRTEVAAKGRQRVAAEWDWANADCRLRHWGDCCERINNLPIPN